MSANNRISNLIEGQVPFFVRNDHQTFVKFLEAYYEYLEQEDKTVHFAKNLQQYQDIDQTVDIFSEKLYDLFLKLFPDDMLADKNLILKNVKDFYRSRGTEKSIRFLLNVLYGIDDIDFYYPKDDVLRASDGKWFVEKSLKIQDVFLDGVADDSIDAAEFFEGTRIRGNTSNAFATVEKVDTYFQFGTLVKELKLTAQQDEFDDSEIIFTTFEDENGVRTLKANVFSGEIVSVSIENVGSGYIIGDEAVVESDTGTGAIVRVTDVTVGNISSIQVVNGGAGFQVSDYLLISGGGGSGANAEVLSVVSDGSIHPNSYNIAYSTISLEANTTIGNTVYSNLSSSNANTTIANSLSYFEYANTGPVQIIQLNSTGNNYSSLPSIDVDANSRIRSLQILGRMQINDGGLNYQINDTIEFINPIGGYGTGAAANVKNVDANGVITEVQFVEVPGFIIGGSGYNELPTANVITSTGNGANITVTAILGDGERFLAANSTIGSIEELTIIRGGSGYSTAPTINLSSSGDGTAQASAEIITGTFSYSGRWLNDDGHLSSYNFLQDRDYYQNFSYVIRIKKSISKYRQALKELIHPSGMKLFGEYTFVDNGETLTPKFSGTDTTRITFTFSTYQANLGNVIINTTNHGLVSNDIVYLEFVSGDTENVTNGIFTVVNANTDYFDIIHSANTINTSGNVYTGITIE